MVHCPKSNKFESKREILWVKVYKLAQAIAYAAFYLPHESDSASLG